MTPLISDVDTVVFKVFVKTITGGRTFVDVDPVSLMF